MKRLLKKLIEFEKKISNPPEKVAGEISRCLFSSKLAQTHVLVDRPILKTLWALGSILPEPIVTYLTARQWSHK